MKRITLVISAVLCMLTLLAGCGNTSGTYKAGTYTATAEGYGGDVTVEVEFDEESILSVSVIDQAETVGVGDRAVENLPVEMVEAQTWEVDAITAATVTSDSIKATVKDCMEQAENK